MNNSSHLLELATSSTFASLLDAFNVNYSAFDLVGNCIIQNQSMINSISGGLLKAKEIDRAAWEDCKLVMESKKKVVREEEFDGKFYLSIKQPILQDNEVSLGIVILSIDITERKKAEVAKTEFLRNIRHDIRTPVSGIVGVAHLLKESIQDNPELKIFINSLVASSDALLGILDEIFEAVNLATGKLLTVILPFSLKSSLEMVLSLHQAKALEKQLSLTLDYDAQLPPKIWGDALRVQKISWELVTNAIKYTHQGYITLSARQIRQDAEQIWVEVSVADTGIGIPADKHDVIFEQFTRLSNSYSGTTRGRGLGLSHVKQLITELKAEIKLVSQLGQGSTFSCLIPFTVPV